MKEKDIRIFSKVELPANPWWSKTSVTPGHIPLVAGGIIPSPEKQGVFAEDYLKKCKEANFNVVRVLNGGSEDVKSNCTRAQKYGLKTFMRLGIKSPFSLDLKYTFPDNISNLTDEEYQKFTEQYSILQKVNPNNTFWSETYRNWKNNLREFLNYSLTCINNGQPDPLDTVTGLMVVDEPGAAYFWGMSEITHIIWSLFRLLRPDRIPFIMSNLFFDLTCGNKTSRSLDSDTNRLSGGLNHAANWLVNYEPIKSYEDYVNLYADLTLPTVLSFDCYPFEKETGNKEEVDKDKGIFRWQPMRNFFETLIFYSDQSNKRTLDFWSTVMCCKFEPPEDENSPLIRYNPTPTIGRLRFAAFIALLYGAKGIQYWDVAKSNPQDGSQTKNPIDADGSTTETYGMVKTLNTQIKAIENILLSSTLEETVVTKNPPYTYTVVKDNIGKPTKIDNKEIIGLIKRTVNIGIIASFITTQYEGEGYIIAVMNNDDYLYTLVASMNPDSTQSVTLRFVSPNISYLEPVDENSTWQNLTMAAFQGGKSFTFEPGDIKVFRMPLKV